MRAIESLKDFLHADKRVKCVSNEYLLPIQDNWNKAVSLGTGKYIKLMGADDRMLPGSIKMMESIIKSEPTVEFHGHLAILIDEKGELIRKQRPYGKGFVGQPITGAAALKGKLRQQVRFKEPACNFYLKSAWEKIGGYDTKFRFSADVHFNSKLMSTSKSMLWNEYLVELRRHQGSDGAQLPAALALSNLEGFVDELLLLLGSEVTAQDRAVGKGWVQYRIIELVAQRFRQHPTAVSYTHLDVYKRQVLYPAFTHSSILCCDFRT